MTAQDVFEYEPDDSPCRISHNRGVNNWNRGHANSRNAKRTEDSDAKGIGGNAPINRGRNTFNEKKKKISNEEHSETRKSY
jgi:hypothetical protein